MHNLRAKFQLTNVAGWIKWTVDSRLKKKINFGLILGANKKNLIKGAFKQNSSL